MKIAVNSRVLPQPGTGIPYYIKNLYSKLQEIDKKNSYIFFQTSRKKTVGKTFIVSGKINGFFAALFDLFFVNKLIKQHKPEIFHGTSFMMPFFRRKGVKYVVTIHDLAFLALKKEPNDYSFFYYLFTKYGIKRSLQVADIVIADSFNTKNDIIKYYRTKAEKIEVVHLGINEEFLQNKINKRLIKEKYILSVSTNPKRKNTLSVLRALSKSQKLKGYNYVIAGLIPEQQKTELLAEIRNLNLDRRVKIFGYASEDQLSNLYQNAELFIYPSFYEGFGFPVVEAMTANCPVITSNNSSLIELMPNKDWLVNPYSISNIRRKMEKLIGLTDKEKTALVKKNRKFAERFSWDISAGLMIKLFKKITSE